MEVCVCNICTFIFDTDVIFIYFPAGGKLASLEEFKVQKEDLMNKMESLEEELKKQEEEHKNEIYKIEKKQVVDKDR